MGFEEKRFELFAKAGELAQFGAGVTVVIVSSDGKNIYTYSMPDLNTIYARCLKTENPPAFHHFEPVRDVMQLPVEIDLRGEGAQMLKQKMMKLLDEDISSLNYNEVSVLEKQLKDGMRRLKDRKVQLLLAQLSQSRKREQELWQQNQILRGQVIAKQSLLRTTRPGCFPSTSSVVPYATNQRPGTASNDGCQVHAFFPSTSSAAPIATDVNQSDRDEDPSDSVLSLSTWMQN